MLISTVIDSIKNYCGGTDLFTGKPIEEASTRDKVTYGNIDQECTGIVTCIWPTADIIRRARELGANLIVTHEALYWNHGDHEDVVASNSAYQAKRALLDTWAERFGAATTTSTPAYRSKPMVRWSTASSTALPTSWVGRNIARVTLCALWIS